MLVSEKTAKAMYDKDSFFYKNFSFLFQNSLWNRSVPAGFPICPYFWMALFSAWIFKPFIYPIPAFVLKPASIKLATVLTKLDQWIQRRFNMKLPHDDGGGILLLLLSISLMVALYCVINGIAKFVVYLLGFMDLAHVVLTVAIPLSILPLVGWRVYIERAGHRRCSKLHWMHTVAWATGVLALLSVLALPELLTGLVLMLSWIVGAIGTVFSAVLFVVLWCLGLAWHAVSFVAQQVASLVVAYKGPILALIIGYVGALVAVKILMKILDRLPEPKVVEGNQNEGYKPTYAYKWESLFFDAIMGCSGTRLRRHGDTMLSMFYGKDTEKYNADIARRPVCGELVRAMIKVIIKPMIIDNLKGVDLPKSTRKSVLNRKGRADYDLDFIVPYYSWEYLEAELTGSDICIKDISKAFTLCHEMLYIIRRLGANPNLEEAHQDPKIIQVFKAFRVAVYMEFKQREEIVSAYLPKYQKRLAARKARHQKLEAFCNVFSQSLVPARDGLVRNKKRLTSAIKYLGSLFVLGFKLLKKKKSEACPYFMFTENKKEE